MLQNPRSAETFSARIVCEKQCVLEVQAIVQSGVVVYSSIHTLTMSCRAFIDGEPYTLSTWQRVRPKGKKKELPLHKAPALIPPSNHKGRNVDSMFFPLKCNSSPPFSCRLLPLNYFACVDNCRTHRPGLLRKINPARFTSWDFFFFQFARPEKQSQITNHRGIVLAVWLTAEHFVPPRRKVGITLDCMVCERGCVCVNLQQLGGLGRVEGLD